MNSEQENTEEAEETPSSLLSLLPPVQIPSLLLAASSLRRAYSDGPRGVEQQRPCLFRQRHSAREALRTRSRLGLARQQRFLTGRRGFCCLDVREITRDVLGEHSVHVHACGVDV